MTKLSLSLLLSLSLSSFGELIFREDFKVIDAHIPVTSKDLTSTPFLSLERHGEGADQYKLSHHPNVKNDPHYVWNGKTTGPTALSFPFAKPIDLSKDDAHLNLRTKNVGSSRLHLALKTKDGWIVVDQGIGADKDWTTHKILLAGSLWRKFDFDNLKPGRPVAVPDLSSVTALAFFNPVKPEGSKNCTRLDWFELQDSKEDLDLQDQ